MSPSVGRSFGGYRLLRSIASDAISTTYHAMPNDPGAADDGHRPRFTIRIVGRLHGDDGHADELVQRFVAGVHKAGAIDHPSILRPRDLGVVDGHPYVVTPFVRAVPLGEMLGHGGAINESTALALFAQLAGGLDAAHRAGVVHGTLSPTTIWVGPSTGSGVAYVGYLTGFAASELLRERLATDTRPDPLADVLYAAPEQLRGEPATGASDQYALACALYHTLAGEPPFRADTRSKLYGAHLMTAPPVLRDIDAAAATSTSAALRRGMEKDPTRRHATCGMLINAALPDRSDGASDAVPAPASPASTGRAVAVAHRRQRRQRWPLLLVGLAVVLAVVLWLQRGAGRESSATPLPAAEDLAALAASDEPTSAADGSSDSERWVTEISDVAVSELTATRGAVVAVDDEGTASLLRSDSGVVAWRARSGGGPLAVGDGVVAHADRQLTVRDARTGRPRWTRPDAPTAALQLRAGTVIGAAVAADGPEVLAVDVSDGTEVWHLHGLFDGGRAPMITTVGEDLVFVMQSGRLIAVDAAAATKTAQRRRQVGPPRWQVDVVDAWPLLAAVDGGVAVANRAGQLCVHGATDGLIAWCAPVPGADREQPRLLTTVTGLVASTSRAVVAFDPRRGAQRWSRSPGSPANLVAASGAVVAIADGVDGLLMLETSSGEHVLAVSDLAEVTAVAARGRWVAVGTADGRVRRFDVGAGA